MTGLWTLCRRLSCLSVRIHLHEFHQQHTFDDQSKALCSEPELRPCLFQLPGPIVYVSVLIHTVTSIKLSIKSPLMFSCYMSYHSDVSPKISDQLFIFSHHRTSLLKWAILTTPNPAAQLFPAQW